MRSWTEVIGKKNSSPDGVKRKKNFDISHRIYTDHELEIILRPFLKFVPPTIPLTPEPPDHPTMEIGEEEGMVTTE